MQICGTVLSEVSREILLRHCSTLIWEGHHTTPLMTDALWSCCAGDERLLKTGLSSSHATESHLNKTILGHEWKLVWSETESAQLRLNEPKRINSGWVKDVSTNDKRRAIAEKAYKKEYKTMIEHEPALSGIFYDYTITRRWSSRSFNSSDLVYAALFLQDGPRLISLFHKHQTWWPHSAGEMKEWLQKYDHNLVDLDSHYVEKARCSNELAPMPQPVLDDSSSTTI